MDRRIEGIVLEFGGERHGEKERDGTSLDGLRGWASQETVVFRDVR